MEYKKKVLILVNHDLVIYNFRKELVEKLIESNYQVIICSPNGKRIKQLIEMGCEYKEIVINRHGTNPVQDIRLIKKYYDVMNEVKPSIVLTYTIKPNIYGGFVARVLKIPYVANITGLGSAVEKESFIQKITLSLYKVSFKKINKIYFQNEENMLFFKKNNLISSKFSLVPGSGVNLNEFKKIDYPEKEEINFIFISRIMKEKGIDQYLEAATFIKKKYKNVNFHICGFCEEDYENKLEMMNNQGIIKYHGMVDDIREILKFCHCTIHPSYYPEGISNVLLESAASGRPLITTDRSGCREVVDESMNGFIIKQKNVEDLISKIEKFIKLDYKRKCEMGTYSRNKVEKEFNRDIIVNDYMSTIEEIV